MSSRLRRIATCTAIALGLAVIWALALWLQYEYITWLRG
jgi:hypothetical protein